MLELHLVENRKCPLFYQGAVHCMQPAGWQCLGVKDQLFRSLSSPTCKISMSRCFDLMLRSSLSDRLVCK